MSKLRIKSGQPIRWQTKAGNFETTEQVVVQFQLPELSKSKVIEWKMHVDSSKNLSKSYNMIIGTDLLQELGFTLDFNNNIIIWDDATVAMKDKDYFHEDENLLENLHEEFFDSNVIMPLTLQMTKIADSKYKKANLEEVVAKCMHLSTMEENKLY